MHGGHYYQSYGSTYISTPTAVFLPDGNTMLSWDDSNGRLMVWNMSTMTISHAHKFSNYGTPAVSHDGNFVTVAVSDQVSIWRLPRFEHVRTIDRPSGGWIRSCALSHDGTLVAIAYSRREDNREFFQVVVYRVSDGQLVLATRTSPSEWFFNPIFSPDGRFLVVRETYDYYSVYRRSDSGFTFAAYVGSSRYSLPRFSPDGRLFALYDSSNLNRIVFYDTSSWTTRGNMYLSTHSSLSTYAFSNDSTLLALGYSRPYYENRREAQIEIWRISDGQLLRTLRGHASPVASVSFSANNDLLVSGGRDGVFRVWRLSDGANIYISEVGATIDVAFSPNGELLATVSKVALPSEMGIFPIVCVFRASDGVLLRVLEADTYSSERRGIAFSPDGTMLAVGSWPALRVWRVSDWSLLREFPIRGAFAFSPNSRLIAVADGYRSFVAVYRLSDGLLTRVLSGHQGSVLSVAFSPDGRLLASAGDDGTIRFYRTVDGLPAGVLTAHTGKVFSIAFSPNGKLLASAGEDRTIRLWRTADNSLLRIMGTNYERPDRQLTFSPDSKLLLSSSSDSITVWRVSNGTPIARYEGYGQLFGREVYSVKPSPDGSLFAYASALDINLGVARMPQLEWEGDVNGDGCVDDLDLLEVLFTFGESGIYLPQDVNYDGQVDDADLLLVLFDFSGGC